MRFAKPASRIRTHWYVGIAAVLALSTLAIRAGDFGEAAPLPTAPPEPAVVERIRAFEAGTLRGALDLSSYAGPDGRPVYLVTPMCCDRFTRLYDAEGRFICSPSGGFGGSGDGQCPDWVRDEDRWRRLRLPPAPFMEPAPALRPS